MFNKFQDIVRFLFGWIAEAVKISVLQGQSSKWKFGSYFGLTFKEFMNRIYPVIKKNLYWNSLSGLVQCYDAITAKKGVHYQSISHFIGLMHESLKISNLSLIVSLVYLMHNVFVTLALVCSTELSLMFLLRTQILLINLKVFLFLSNPFKPLAIFVLPNSTLFFIHPDWGGYVIVLIWYLHLPTSLESVCIKGEA